MRVLAVWLCVIAMAAAGEAVPPGPPIGPVPVPAPAPPPEGIDAGEAPKPGDEAPTAPVAPCAIRFDWDGYVSVVVIGEGVGMVRPAWVATWKKAQVAGERDEYQVAYRATVFRDARGRTHVDARHAAVSGPLAANGQWSPDSFAIGQRRLWSCDDRGSAHIAETGGENIPAARDEYRSLLRQVQSLVEGGL